jgi:glucokinase
MTEIGTRILLGDIGGTNSRFALVSLGETVPRSARRYKNTLFESFRDAIETYITDVGERPAAGVTAIAGPIAGEVVGPTNLIRWRFRPPELAAELGFSRLEVINDFEAVAQALPYLPKGEMVAVGNVIEGAKDGNVAVLGPGTGLGVGALIRAGPRWAAVPSEGGHAEIGAPIGHWRLAHEIIRVHVGRVSGEHVLSGPGLERIDAALRELEDLPDRPSAVEIGTRAVAGTDRIAIESVRLFFDYLARFSGDVALMFAAKGGVYLYGGVVQKLAALMDASRFRTAFEAKSPMEHFLEAIPIHLITNPAPALTGCAAVAAEFEPSPAPRNAPPVT